jgi:enediyne biosynthesis protein E5
MALPFFARLDARWFQILFLSSFLGLGVFAQELALSPSQLILTLAVALAVQAMWMSALSLPGRYKWAGYLSPVISSFGICILVRSSSYWVHPLLAAVAMSSKFIFRAGPTSAKSHVFNPANLAAFIAFALLPDAWLSPGQWGSETGLALWFMALGGIVTRRVSRWGSSLVFLGAWAALLLVRLAWLGFEPSLAADIWVQQLTNGAILLFAFFMISDPMTTPQRPLPRMMFAFTVALVAFVWQFVFFKPHGPIVALFLLSPLVPVLNYFWRTQRFEWQTPKLT